MSANYAGIQEYEAMIAALSKFQREVIEACDELSSAGNECVTNMDEDVNAPKQNAKVQKSVANIRASLETVPPVIQGLQEQIEELRRTEID